MSFSSAWNGALLGKYVLLFVVPFVGLVKLVSNLYIADAAPARGSRKKVVILGGGYAGTTVAKALDKKFDVTVVDRQNHMTQMLGILRAIADRKCAPLTLIPYDKLLQDGVVVQAEITAISETQVTISTTPSGKSRALPFDFLVVATGANWAFPGKPSSPDALEALGELEECGNDVAKSTSVAIIGGGAVGLELACEIKFHHPQKKVTLIHSRQQLIGPGLSGKFHTKLADKLQRLGVEVLLNERVQMPAELSGRRYYAGPRIAVRTESGKEVGADLVFRCTGTTAARSHLGFFESLGCLDQAGRIRVNEHLQVQGFSNIFAIGDCCNTPEQKLASHAMKHAAAVAANIAALGKGAAKPPKKYAPQKGVGVVIPIGTKDGIAEMQGMGLPTFLIVLLMSKDLMAARIWKELGHAGVSASSPDAALLSAANRASAATAKAYAPR